VADPHVDQRLAAILAADVAGYSRLMEADETATVATLEACRLIFREHIETNRGRVVDTAGDSVLAIFETATGAVRAAMAIQAQMADQNKAVPEDRRMRFRIGINLGEIIEKPDGTIYGAGVNVAARLESIAEHGGICISESAHLQVRNKLDLSFEDLGQQAVKNIAEPVRAYRANLNGAGEEPSSAAVTDGSDRPSIAVLAFENLSGDPEQEYFADGIAEDLITALSRIRWLLVIARNSTFTYKGKAVVLVDDAVDAFVAGLADGLACLGARTAVTHADQKIDDQLLEKRRRALLDALQDIGTQLAEDFLVSTLDLLKRCFFSGHDNAGVGRLLVRLASWSGPVAFPTPRLELRELRQHYIVHAGRTRRHDLLSKIRDLEMSAARRLDQPSFCHVGPRPRNPVVQDTLAPAWQLLGEFLFRKLKLQTRFLP